MINTIGKIIKQIIEVTDKFFKGFFISGRYWWFLGLALNDWFNDSRSFKFIPIETRKILTTHVDEMKTIDLIFDKIIAMGEREARHSTYI